LFFFSMLRYKNMGGGLMQLVAYGAQDIYLTGNPQITFFKVVYRRHTNFSMEAIAQTWNGTSDTTSSRCTATISRNGDLVYRMYLELDGTTVADGNNPTSSTITNIELEIGGQKIDKHSGLWMETWAELTEKNPTGDSVDNGNTLFQQMSGMGGVELSTAAAQKYFVPLQFWFCRNPGLALPLIALQYHEVKVILNHTFGDTAFWNTLTSNKLYCDYIYLDTDERRRFAQVSHEYLIEQVQEQELNCRSTSQDLNFNHPVKELIWTNITHSTFSATASSLAAIGSSTTGTYKLKLNGHDRFSERDYRYFSKTQIWEHHSGPGGLASDDAASTTPGTGCFNDSIGVYSFALKPEEHQPSGTCNFSRIDNAQLEGGATACNAGTIFAVNYNVLRIMSGMGGLAYSN
jgi:hypothetical protein